VRSHPLGHAAFPFLTIGAAAIVAYALVPSGLLADLLFIGTCASAAIMVAIGIRRGRPAARRAWSAICLTLTMLTLANVIVLVSQQLGAPEVRVAADGLFMLAYLPLFAGGFVFGRGLHRSDGTVLLDSGIVALAAVPLVWEFVIEPNVSAGETVTAVIATSLPVVDILLVSLVAPLLLLRTSRSWSGALLVLAFALMGVGDSLYAAESLGATFAHPVAMNLTWLATYVLLGTAALVPSSVLLGTEQDANPGAGDVARLFVVALALLVVPVVIIRETAGASEELLVFAVVSLAVGALLVLRLRRTVNQLAAVDRRFRRFMSHAGTVAAIKDAAGRYIYMNPSAQAMERMRPDWYGRTDAELYPPNVAAHRTRGDADVRRTGRSIIEPASIDGRTWHTERFLMPGTTGDVGILGVDITDRLRVEEAVHFQATLLASVRDVVIVADVDRRVTYWNRGAEEILGFESSEMLGQRMDDIIPEDNGATDEFWAQIRAGFVHEVDWEARRRDGSDVWLNVRISPLTGPDGAVTGFLGVANDITARKQANLELARQGAAMQNTTDAIVITDADDDVVYVNPAFVQATGFSLAEIRAQRRTDDPIGRPFRRALAQARAERGTWRGDIVDRRRDGTDLISETSISPIVVDGQASTGHVTIQRDVTRERAAARMADRVARERVLIAETLTALRAGQTPEETSRAVARRLVKLPEVAIASVIVFGHDARATVLGQADRADGGVVGIELPQRRGTYLQQRAAAGPWVEGWEHDETHPYAEMLHDLGVIAHAYAPIVADRRPIGLLVVGSDSIDAVDRMTERLPALREFAAITATLLGGQVADRMAEARSRAELQAIIDASAFHAVFQPIVQLETGAIDGYEGLMRFTDGTAPDARFEAASRLGVGLALEQVCLDTIFSAARDLPAGPWLNVNVSPELVLADLVEELLPDSRRRVVLEITEHEAITDYAAFRAAVQSLRGRVQVAVDDAGAGFASLRHIVELQPAMVKLDRSLVVGIDEDSARQAVVSGMVRFAQAAGLVLIAEGIETDAELATLGRLGVTYGQGFLLGIPERLRPSKAPRLSRQAAPGRGVGRRRPALVARPVTPG
jgi:PAS domain S-box-containing protein